MTVILPVNSDQTYEPILGIVFTTKQDYLYMGRKIGKIISIWYDNKHSWMQWIFHFQYDVLCFSEKDPCIRDIMPVDHGQHSRILQSMKPY